MHACGPCRSSKRPKRRQLLEEFFSTDSERIRHAVLQAVSLLRDPHVLNHSLMVYALNDPSPANRRLVAEALGRLGDRFAVPQLLSAADKADDRVLQHSIIYALIELADPSATRNGLTSNKPRTIAAALIALDQMPGGDLTASDVVPHLGADDDTLRQAARWVVMQHPDWGSELTEWLRTQLEALPAQPAGDADRAATANLESLLQSFSSNSAIQQLLADAATARESSPAVRALALAGDGESGAARAAAELDRGANESHRRSRSSDCCHWRSPPPARCHPPPQRMPRLQAIALGHCQFAALSHGDSRRRARHRGRNSAESERRAVPVVRASAVERQPGRGAVGRRRCDRQSRTSLHRNSAVCATSSAPPGRWK